MKARLLAILATLVGCTVSDDDLFGPSGLVEDGAGAPATSGGQGGDGGFEPPDGGDGSGGDGPQGGSQGTGGASGGSGGSGGTGASGGSAGEGGTGGDGGQGGSSCIPAPCPGGPFCGQWDDGCGGFSQCSFSCSPGEQCGSDNMCHSCPIDQESLCQAAGAECGPLTATVCGQSIIVSCGTPSQVCGTLEHCDANHCVGCFLGGPNICGTGDGTPYEWTCPASYSNNIQDGTETDVDCGGPWHPRKCAIGDSCQTGADCLSSACVSGTCANSGNPPQTSCDWYGNVGVYCCPYGS